MIALACRAQKGLWTAVAAFGLCTAPAQAAPPAPPLVLEVQGTPAGFVLSAAPREGNAERTQREEVEVALIQGHRSQLVLQVRVYRRTRGLAALLGDRLERHMVLGRTIRPEPIAGRYVLEESVDGVVSRTTVADRAADLLDAFFTVKDLAIPLDGHAPGSFYVRAQYRLSPVRIAPQLALVALFADMGERSSDWSVAEGLDP